MVIKNKEDPHTILDLISSITGDEIPHQLCGETFLDIQYIKLIFQIQ